MNLQLQIIHKYGSFTANVPDLHVALAAIVGELTLAEPDGTIEVRAVAGDQLVLSFTGPVADAIEVFGQPFD